MKTTRPGSLPNVGPRKSDHSIEDPFVIAKILSHLEGRGGSQEPATLRFGARAPPPAVC